jgi:hypothetical protein
MTPEVGVGETSKQLSLCWIGPFSWTGREDNLFVAAPDAAGVYVWALPVGDAFLPYYVGETQAGLRTRMRAHLQCYCSGMYTIYEAGAFRVGTKKLVWRGTVYQSDFSDRLAEFVRRMPELVGHVYGLLDALRVFFAPLEVEKRVLRRVEGEVAWLLGQAPAPYGTFQDEGLQYQRRKMSEEPVFVNTFGAPKGFILPSRFEA